MTHETHCDLLEFLADVSRQVDALLNQDVLEENRYEDSPRAVVQERLADKLDHLYNKSQLLHSAIDLQHSQQLMLLNSNRYQNQDYHQPLNDLQLHQQLSTPYPQNATTFSSNDTRRQQNEQLASQVIQHHQYHQYFPPASNNFVNFTQYSAKQSQRQFTGHLSRDENPLVNFAMPKQDYQPECAYCYWLATSPSSSSIVSMSQMNVATTTNNNTTTNDHHHQFDTSNYAYHNG